MGALYIIAGIVAAGMVLDLVTSVAGDDKAEKYDYHFAPGVGAVFGSVR